MAYAAQINEHDYLDMAMHLLTDICRFNDLYLRAIKDDEIY